MGAGIAARVEAADSESPRAVPPLILLACLEVAESPVIDSAVRGDQLFSDYPRVRGLLQDRFAPLLKGDVDLEQLGLGHEYEKHIRSFLAQTRLPGHLQAERARRERVVRTALQSNPRVIDAVALSAGVNEAKPRSATVQRMRRAVQRTGERMAHVWLAHRNVGYAFVA